MGENAYFCMFPDGTLVFNQDIIAQLFHPFFFNRLFFFTWKTKDAVVNTGLLQMEDDAWKELIYPQTNKLSLNDCLTYKVSASHGRTWYDFPRHK